MTNILSLIEVRKICLFFSLRIALPGLVSKKKNRTLTENEAFNQAINADLIFPESDASHYSPNPFASLSNTTTPRHEADSALQSVRQD